MGKEEPTRKDLQDLFARKTLVFGTYGQYPDSIFLLRHPKTNEKLGVEAGVLLAWLCRKSRLLKSEERDGWFYQTATDIRKALDYLEGVQQRLIAKLISYGLIEKKVIGRPPKRHFRINWFQLMKSTNEVLSEHNIPSQKATAALNELKQENSKCT